MLQNDDKPSIKKRLFTAIRRSRLARSEFINNLYGEYVVRSHGSNEVVTVDGFRVRFDPRDRYIARKLVVDRSFDKDEIDLLCSLIQPGDVVLDIGANIGLYALAMSRAVGPSGTVLAFEPDPDNIRILEHNIAANDCRNIVLIKCGLDDHDGTRELYQSDDNRGFLSFADLCETGRSVSVPVRTADSVLAEYGLKVPAVAKIDVEGAEPLVLAGLRDKPRVMQLEFVPSQIRAVGGDPLAFLRDLESEGYSLQIIERFTARLIPTTAKALLDLADKTKIDYNILATRQ